MIPVSMARTTKATARGYNEANQRYKREESEDRRLTFSRRPINSEIVAMISQLFHVRGLQEAFVV